MRVRLRYAAATAAASAAALVAVVPSANAATTTPPPSTLPAFDLPALQFTPPAVGPIHVVIGPIIIGGHVINPGINLSTPGFTIPWPPAN
jgi:hypothetical protein